MILDTEAQRELLLKMFDGASFPGVILDRAYSTKLAITMAEIAKPAEKQSEEPNG